MKRGFSLIELLVIVAIVGLLATGIFGIVGSYQKRAELKERWMPVCIEDSRKADPSLSYDGALLRCELRWDTEVLPELKRGDKANTTIIYPGR